jgi:uncharacterized protein (DUF1778 family)
MSQKPRKVGRPKLPRGEAKGRIVPLRLSADSFRAVAVAAKTKKQTVSEFVRGAIQAAIA